MILLVPLFNLIYRSVGWTVIWCTVMSNSKRKISTLSNQIEWNEMKWNQIKSKSAVICQQLLRFRMEFSVLGEQSIIKLIWRFYLHIQAWQTNLTYIYFHIKKSLTLNQNIDHDSLIRSNVYFNPGVCKILSHP